MPPKINRAITQIDPEFIAAMIGLYSEWITLNETNIMRATQNTRFEHFGMTAKRMIPIIRRQSLGARVGLDYEITRLSMLPYTNFTVVTGPHPNSQINQQIQWLVGRTKHVTATNYARRTEVMGELGCYDVYIPTTIVRGANLAHIHMIPQRNQLSVHRHYHHYLTTERVTRNPLNIATGNCWGEYSGPLQSLLAEPDFPEFFRQLYNHLSTYGYLPPQRTLDFDTNHKD